MEKDVKYKDNVDYIATLEALEVGEYVIIPSSERDIQNIRANVVRAQAKMDGMSFSVHKTINGARVDRTA